MKQTASPDDKPRVGDAISTLNLTSASGRRVTVPTSTACRLHSHPHPGRDLRGLDRAISCGRGPRWVV
jgi:hypothetical protein